LALLNVGELPPAPKGGNYNAAQLALAVAHNLKGREIPSLPAVPEREAFVAEWLKNQPEELEQAVEAAQKALKMAKTLQDMLVEYQRLLTAAEAAA
jgi:hypothetical protein